MICSSVKRFFTSNLRRLGDWTPNRRATQNRGDVGCGVEPWLCRHDHDTSLALPFGKRVIEALKPYDVEPHLDFVVDHYVVVDLNRYSLGKRKGRLAEAIQALT
jgi:hypothetical protein